MKNTRQTEIEIWYNFKLDILRIVYKNKNKRQLAYYYKWFVSYFLSNNKGILEYYEKIGEL
jgi:hypothetical protein